MGSVYCWKTVDLDLLNHILGSLSNSSLEKTLNNDFGRKCFKIVHPFHFTPNFLFLP